MLSAAVLVPIENLYRPGAINCSGLEFNSHRQSLAKGCHMIIVRSRGVEVTKIPLNKFRAQGLGYRTLEGV